MKYVDGSLTIKMQMKYRSVFVCLLRAEYLHNKQAPVNHIVIDTKFTHSNGWKLQRGLSKIVTFR